MHFTVTFVVDIDLDDIDDAVAEARQLISRPGFEPTNIEVSDSED